MKNLEKKVFFIILFVSVLGIILQINEYITANRAIEIQWIQTINTLGLLTLGLILMNMFAFRLEFQNSGKNEMDTWFTASSVLTLVVFIITQMLLPGIFSI